MDSSKKCPSFHSFHKSHRKKILQNHGTQYHTRHFADPCLSHLFFPEVFFSSRLIHIKILASRSNTLSMTSHISQLGTVRSNTHKLTAEFSTYLVCDQWRQQYPFYHQHPVMESLSSRYVSVLTWFLSPFYIKCISTTFPPHDLLLGSWEQCSCYVINVKRPPEAHVFGHFVPKLCPWMVVLLWEIVEPVGGVA